MRLDKPIGMLLLLWPTLWALWIAGRGHPHPGVLAIFIMGVIVMRTAGCVVNDMIDRRFDAQVFRTRNRPLATGKLPLQHAMMLLLVLLFCAFVLVCLTNQLTFFVALFAVVLTLIYPFAKRYTHCPQMLLGLAFACAVPMAFAAQTGQIPLVSAYLYAAAFLWPIIYDTFYAMVDREDDRLAGIKSTARLFGQYDRVMTAGLQMLWLVLLVLLGQRAQLQYPYYIALLVVTGLCCYQQWLIKERIPARCFHAFLNNHWVGLVVFVGIVLGNPSLGNLGNLRMFTPLHP